MARLPTATVRPSTRPSTPRPVRLSKPCGSASGSPRATAAATIASPSGCSLKRSTDAARRSRSTTRPPPTTCCTAGRPSVTVPVLSNTTVSSRPLRSSGSPPLIRTPSSAPRPVETITAVGTASPMAQGQAMISTVTAATMAWRYAGSGPSTSHSTKVAIAIAITTGTKTAEIRSARRWIGAFDPCACCTSRMMRERTVSAPTRSTRNAQRAVPIEGGADDRVAGPLGDRRRLAGEHGLVHVAAALHHGAVGRDLLARRAPPPRRPG